MAEPRKTPAVAPTTPADETDADLLLYMAMAADDPAGARAAWEEFYRRHAGYLYAVCLRAYGPLLGGEAGAADLTAETFRRAYEHAATFDPAGLTDAAQLRRRTRAWLGRIAQRLALSALRSRGRIPTRPLPLFLPAQAPQPDPPGRAPSPRVRLVRQALLGLSEREQMVLRTTFQWYRPGQDHQRLPNDVVADLAETLQTTPENLRQIRRRAMAKVEAFVRAAEAAPPGGQSADALPAGSRAADPSGNSEDPGTASDEAPAYGAAGEGVRRERRGWDPMTRIICRRRGRVCRARRRPGGHP